MRWPKRWVFHLHSGVPLTALLRTSVLGQLTSKGFGSISHESLSSLCLRILDDLCFLRKHSMMVKSLRLPSTSCGEHTVPSVSGARRTDVVSE